MADYWGFNETQGEHTRLPGTHHCLHAFTTIKHPQFKVTLFQLGSQHPEPAEHGEARKGVF